MTHGHRPQCVHPQATYVALTYTHGGHASSNELYFETLNEHNEGAKHDFL